MSNLFEPTLIHVSETNSTNQLIRTIAATDQLYSGSVVLADYQTAGRGLSSNSWESEAGKNLTFSLFFSPVAVPSNHPFVISEMASLSVKYTLDKYLPDVAVKWPNDVYCGDKKITGILIENTLFQGKITHSIIGIGINVNQMNFLSDAPNPVSMSQIAGTSFDRMIIMDEFRQAFTIQSKRLNQGQFDAIHKDYLNAIYRKNGFHYYKDTQGVFEATFHNIEPTGHLVLERRNGCLSCYGYKEVGFLRIND